MLRLLILASLGAVISANFFPHHLLGYPRSLQSLFGIKRETANEATEREVCKNTECKTIATLLKDSMDETVDPCDDFYEYACGKWSKENPLPENRTDWSLWTMVSEKIENQVLSIIETKPKPSDIFAVKLAKKWYESCMDSEMIEKRGAEPIISTLWRHGGWPLIMEEGEWDDRIYHWQIVDDHFARLLGFNAFHDVYYRSLTYGGNETIVIDTAHLPLGLRKVLDVDAVFNDRDSSDENNESGEGSQEAGSEERGKEQQKENEGKEENEEDENEEDEDKEGENEMSIKRRNHVVKRKNHKRIGHGSRHVHKKGTKKRTRRDAMNKKIVHQILHQLKKANMHKAKSSKHHLSVVNGKSHTKKQNHESKKKLHGKMTKNSKRVSHDKKNNNRVTKKHVHESNLKKKSNVHNNQHHAQKKINHRVHHITNKMKLANHKKMLLSNDTENTDNDMDNDIDTENDNEKGDANDETKNDDEKEDTNTENNEETNDDTDNDVDNKNDDEKDEENDAGNKDDDAEDEENDEDDKNENEQNEDETNNDDEENDEDNKDNDEEETDKDSEEEVNLEELRAEYKEFMLNVSLILSKARGIEIPKETLMKDIDDLFEFSIKIGELTLKDEEPLNTTLREFQEEYGTMDSTTRNGKINWVKKVQKLFAEAGVEIEDDVEITVSNPEYIKKLHTLLDNTPSKTIVNYIHWMFVSTAIMAGPQELRSLAENWLVRRMHFSSRKSECIQIVDINDIVAYEYVQQYFSEETAKTARDMIDDIQKEVEYQIKESTWMNDDTKHFILDKLVNMKNLVGYPSWYKNTTMVKEYFQGLTIGPSYYENLLNYVRHRKWRNLRQIVEKMDESIEYLDPLMLNAFFIPTENSISITAADFQSPFFAVNRPWAVNFGIIGLVMGHEVNHGFDDQGHLYDHGGNLMEWLSAMADAYNKRAECFVDQFNRYSIIQGENYTIENYGNQTAGENIADTMGLQAVFRAYKRRQRECGNPDPALPGLEKFSNDQIFFLSFANLWCETIDRESLIRGAKYDVHSTGRLRVIGSVSNSEDFAKAFNCPVNSPMNPKKKCNIWV